jgi:predicted dehydrogenase
MNEKRISRRAFVGSTASALALGLVTDSLFGSESTAPKKKLNIACIGVGIQGTTNLKNVSQTENIVAICDVDRLQAQKVREFCPDAKYYNDYRVMFEEMPEIDAVIVATPDHAHFGPAMAAIARGKHLYCEKPLAHSIEEVQKMTSAARSAGVKTQMGIQSHSSEHIRRCCEWIWDGAIGEVREVHAWCDRPTGGFPFPSSIARPSNQPPVPDSLDWDAWLGPAKYRPYHPLYAPILWRGWQDFGSGTLGDMGCHILDAPFWALRLGAPLSVEANVSYNPGQQFWGSWADGSDRWREWNSALQEGLTMAQNESYPDAAIVRYKFPARHGMPPVNLTWYDGGLLPPLPKHFPRDKPLTGNGAFFIGEKGMIRFTHNAGIRLDMYPDALFEHYKRNPPSKTIPRVSGPYTDWLEACKSEKNASANFEYSGPLSETVLLGLIAMRVPNKELLWDPTVMAFTNDDKANGYVSKKYRDAWKI